MGATSLTYLPGEGVLRGCGSLTRSIVTAAADIVYRVIRNKMVFPVAASACVFI